MTLRYPVVANAARLGAALGGIWSCSELRYLYIMFRVLDKIDEFLVEYGISARESAAQIKTFKIFEAVVIIMTLMTLAQLKQYSMISLRPLTIKGFEYDQL